MLVCFFMYIIPQFSPVFKGFVQKSSIILNFALDKATKVCYNTISSMILNIFIKKTAGSASRIRIHQKKEETRMLYRIIRPANAPPA